MSGAVREPSIAPDPWTPVRSGRYYCSPACGGGKFCTWAGYQRASQVAAATAAELGAGWKPRVHENLGWHASAVLSTDTHTVSVRAHLEGAAVVGYSAFAGAARGDPGVGLWAGSGKTPRAAVREVKKRARACVADLRAKLTAAESV